MLKNRTPCAIFLGWLGESIILGYAALCFYNWIDFKLLDAIGYIFLAAIVIWYAIRIANPFYADEMMDSVILKI